MRSSFAATRVSPLRSSAQSLPPSGRSWNGIAPETPASTTTRRALAALHGPALELALLHLERSGRPRPGRRWRPGNRRACGRWGRGRGHRPARRLALDVLIVAAYLCRLTSGARKASTIGRRAASIGYHHKLAGHEPPTNQEGVKVVLRGIRRTIARRGQGRRPRPRTC